MGSYRPSYSDAWEPPVKRRKRNNPPERNQNIGGITSYATQSTNPSDDRKNTTHTRRDRKNNRSSRIHSLKNSLARGTLPRDVQQEKERELASLLFDQEKDRTAKGNKQMIAKYHHVRFFERKKAEKKLRRLEKERDDLQDVRTTMVTGSEQSDADSKEQLEGKRKRLGELQKEIHEAKVDLNYTLYCPLNEKYISIFAAESSAAKGKAKPKPPGVKKNVYAMFTEEQKGQLEHLRNDAGNVMESAAGVKPPLWFEVQKCMKNDAGRVQESLESLRNGKLRADQNRARGDFLSFRPKGGGAEQGGRGTKRKRPAWLDEDEDVLMKGDDAEELSNDSEDGGMKLEDAIDEDDFFER